MSTTPSLYHFVHLLYNSSLLSEMKSPMRYNEADLSALFCLLFFRSCSILGNAFFCSVLKTRLWRYYEIFCQSQPQNISLRDGRKISQRRHFSISCYQAAGRGRQLYYPQYFPPCLTRHKLQQVLQTSESSD